jgi:hypothetical protein
LERFADHLLKVGGQSKKWREKGTREMAWLSPDKATRLVDEPGLVTLVEKTPSATPLRNRRTLPSQ